MTEQSFQEARKLMQSANYLRGLITNAKGEVAKWTNIEDACQREMRPAQAEGAKKCLDRAMKKLEELRQKFEAMQFPDSNLKKEYQPACCESCKAPVPQGDKYCGECLYQEFNND